MAVEIGLFTKLLRILPNIIMHGNAIGRYHYLKGYYFVCTQNEAKFYNSPEGIPNFLKIDISWARPKELKVVSKDYDRKNFKCWKTWTNEIVMDGHAGKGKYVYDMGNEIGTHEIVAQGKDKIVVRVIDAGKANWEKRIDNELSTQTWIRVHNNDPMLERLRAML